MLDGGNPVSNPPLAGKRNSWGARLRVAVVKGLAKFPECPRFLVTAHPGHDVPGEAADDLSLAGRQIKFSDHQRDDRCESIPVVEAERG